MVEIYKDLYDKASDITKVDYKAISKGTDSEYFMVYSDEINNMVENLLNEIDRLNDEIKGLYQNINDNYQPIPVSKQVEISDKDFV